MRRLGGVVTLLCLAAAGCASDHVVLLPGEPGHDVGAVAVINEDDSDRGVLSSGYSTTALTTGTGPVAAHAAKQADVDARYGRLLADMPLPPFTERVPFGFDSAKPGPDAQAALQRIFDEVGKRPGAQVQVIGHADAVDSDAVNDQKSRERAEAVRDALVTSGVAADAIRVSWVGKRQPVHDVGDGVPDEANRETEVLVR